MNENGLKILLVDDVDFFRDVMRDYFRRTPATILMAANGQEALDVARKDWPSLIYMDVAMPGMGGIEACRRFKEHPKLSNIPIILTFTEDRDATELEVKQSGCDAYLKKPFGREEFLNLGHRYLFHIDRRERRVPCQMTVEFTINGKTYRGRGVDISMNGLYVEFREEMHPDKRIELTFLLPTISSHRVAAKGRVTWVNQGFPRTNMKMPQGFGVEIHAIDMQSAEVIRRYIEQN
ncbi:MAG: response regulator [Desulfuromonadales bacterium]|nr:response regulator [Desulfuromonadales bacterium]